MRRLAMMTVVLGLVLAAPVSAADGPRYDVPRGFTRCSDAVSWHGFFKWASQRDTSCRATARFMRAYAERAGGSRMPRHVEGFECRMHYWRNEDGDTYASRHVCTKRGVTIRFYGMV